MASHLFDELMQQHDALRAHMDRCEQLADDLDAGRAPDGVLTSEVASLRVAFDAHNQFEERWLRPVLLDAFDDMRVDRMFADHVGEHREMRQHFGDGPIGELRAALDNLRAHLAAEERYFASSRILREDSATNR